MGKRLTIVMTVIKNIFREFPTILIYCKRFTCQNFVINVKVISFVSLFSNGFWEIVFPNCYTNLNTIRCQHFLSYFDIFLYRVTRGRG